MAGEDAMDWQDKLKLLCDIYNARAFNEGPESLNEVETAIAFVFPFQMEMTNGGFWSFFQNSTGLFVPETVAALRSISADKAASLLSQAIQIYFHEHPIPLDTRERRQLMKKINGDRTDEATRVDNEYGKIDEPALDDLLLEYVQANQGRLRLIDDEGAIAIPLEGDWRQCTKCWDGWELAHEEFLANCPACKALTVLRDAPPEVT
jgi:Domain of unknown function (DUF4375)